MKSPKLPTKDELGLFEAVEAGTGRKLIQLHFDTVRREQDREDWRLEAQIEQIRHVRLYRYFSVASGCVVALLSLGLCAYSIGHDIDFVSLAWILGPLAGLAGVFVWGCRPSGKDETLAPPDGTIIEVPSECPHKDAIITLPPAATP